MGTPINRSCQLLFIMELTAWAAVVHIAARCVAGCGQRKHARHDRYS